MDIIEAAKIVSIRINMFEPQSVTNQIIGFLLIEDRLEDMIRLAFGPDAAITNLIRKVKVQLRLVPPVISPPISPSPRPFLPFNPLMTHSPRPFPPFQTNPLWTSQLDPDSHIMSRSKFIREGFSLQSQSQAMGTADQFEFGHAFPKSKFIREGFSLQSQPQAMGTADQFEFGHAFPSDYRFAETPLVRGPRSASEFPIKACHYHNKGFCKHGENCRFFHGQSFPDHFSQIDEDGFEEQDISAGSLERLELEITEILKKRRGPLSIASIPRMYYEKYGRTLQAEGYLTESQRHGKAGYSLTKLLARLNNIQLIDKPHGQHSVILAEDAQRYFENCGDRNDSGPVVSESRQIYLTFPPESTFSEDDVSEYFSANFGHVHDVRIPCPSKRMFGFVTFASADTVNKILSKGNPHNIGGARVLVKPYRDNPKLIDKNYREKLNSVMFYGSCRMDIDSDLQSRWESSRFMRQPYMMPEEGNLEAQMRQFLELQLAPRSLRSHPNAGYSMEEGHSESLFAERCNYLLNDLNDDDSRANNFSKETKDNDSESSDVGVVLPDSPFAPSIGNDIIAAT